MTRWMRILCVMLCLCVLCAIAAVGSSAAAALPVTFSTTGNVYRYAVSKTDPDTVTYGANAPTSAAGSGTAALSGRGISVSLDTGESQNFELCYKEIPVTVTVPANTTYTVALKFELNGTYTRKSTRATAKASFQVVYLGDASADKTTVFYPYKKSGNTIKTTIGGSDANTNIVQITMDDATTVSRSATKSYDFVNTTRNTKDITKYFGVWIAGNFGSKFSNRATATCTVTPASYLVTFDPNGGRVSPTSTAVTIGKKYGTLPTPNRTGYSFDGWYTEKIGGKDKEVTETDVVGTNPPTTLYAHWTANQYLVALDANGGKIDTTSGQVNKKNYTATYGSKYNFLPTPTRTGGYKFVGWYTEPTGGTKVTSDTTVTTAKTHILYAHWSLKPATAPASVKLTMDETSVYGAEFSRRVSVTGSSDDYTTTYTWYTCEDEEGKNGKPLTDENGNPTDPKRPTAGTHYYYVVVTVTRKDNGLEASKKSNVACITVSKATPTISTPPKAAALDLTVGNTLAASALTGGIAKNYNIRSGSNDVAGRFAWKDANFKPPLGSNYYDVVFYPVDTANYEPTETTVKVKVTCSHRFGAWSAGRRTCTVCGEKEVRYNTVTVTWGALAYTYTDGTWNPATHAYDIGGGWKPNQENGDIITVRNDSADIVRVRFQYTKADTAIGGSFVTSDEYPIYSAIDLPINRTQTVWLRLTGRPDTALNNANIGSVTVKLERN